MVRRGRTILGGAEQLLVGQPGAVLVQFVLQGKRSIRSYGKSFFSFQTLREPATACHASLAVSALFCESTRPYRWWL